MDERRIAAPGRQSKIYRFFTGSPLPLFGKGGRTHDG
jgi:hypothetical protein